MQLWLWILTMIISLLMRNLLQKIIFSFIKNYFLLVLGFFVIVLNVYGLPFVIWTAGVVRPWFITHGLIPFRDFTWIRMPLDLFLLAGWFMLWGSGPLSYQSFVFFLFLILSIFIFFSNKLISHQLKHYGFLFFIAFLFPLFINAEEGEVLISLIVVITFIVFFRFLETGKIKWLLIGGFFSGLLIICKQNTVFTLLAIASTLVTNGFIFKKKKLVIMREFFLYILSAGIPYSLVVIFYAINHGLSDFFYYTIYAVLGPYRGENNKIQEGDAIFILMGYIMMLIPFLLYWRKTALRLSQVILIVSLIISLFFSVLPSFLTYRTITSYGLVSIVAGFNMSILFSGFKNKVSPFSRIFIIFSFAIFFILIYRSLTSYMTFFHDNGISWGQLITDYHEDEYKIAHWVSTHTKESDKILNYGSEIIYFLSNRLPPFKYIEPFPFVLQPYLYTSSLYIKNPPLIVVFDTAIEKDHVGFEKWPFIDFLKSDKYHVVSRYGESLILYQYSK